LSAVLPFEFVDNDTTRLWQGKVRAEQTRALLVQILAGVTVGVNGSSPLLLVMEDAHWLDSASWALLKQVQHEIKPLLLVIATRPMLDAQGSATSLPAEYRELLTSSELQVVKLAALPAADTLTLVCRRLGVASLPLMVADFILEKTEGHPFFSEELAYALRDAELIKIHQGQCQLASEVRDLHLLNFPDTLQGVIISRIDRLTPPQQLTLKVASVIGRIFAFRVLHEIHPLEADKRHLPVDLDILERLDLTLLDSPEPELAYIFKHVITQEVVYNLMAYALRRQLHQVVAEWYEQAHAGELTPFYPLLAHHWRQVVAKPHPEPHLLAKAIDYSRQAARQAEAKYAYEEATQHLQAALDLTPAENPKIRLAVLEELANVYRLLNKGVQAVSLYQVALEAWRNIEGRDNFVAARLHRQIIETAFETKFRTALEQLQAVSLAREAAQASLETIWRQVKEEPPQLETVRLVATLSRAKTRFSMSPDWDAAEAYARTAVALAEQLDAPVELSDALSALAGLFRDQGRLREYAEISLRRVALSRDPRFTDLRERLRIVSSVGHVMGAAGEYTQALAYYQEAEALAIQMQAIDLWVETLTQQSECYLYLDRWDAVLKLDETLRDLQRRYSPERLGTICALDAISATVHALQGEFYQARVQRDAAYNFMAGRAGPLEQWLRGQHY
jgi:tetratricopeptide (TPR) repeat protein